MTTYTTSRGPCADCSHLEAAHTFRPDTRTLKDRERGKCSFYGPEGKCDCRVYREPGWSDAA